MLMFSARLFLRSFRYLPVCVAVLSLLFAPAAAQKSSVGQAQPSPEDIKKFAAIAGRFGQLSQKLRTRVTLPTPRTESHLLPLLPESTLMYAAIPNYGEATRQALTVFREELKTNAELRAWWQKGDMATEGPKMEDRVEKFCQLSEYLGDEVVAFGQSEGKEDPKFLVLAEVRKPGLKGFLKQILQEVAGESKPAALVFDAAELAVSRDIPSDQPVILVRDNLVAFGENLATLRKFSAQLEQQNSGFAATSFGRRLAQSYGGGTSIIAAADIHAILDHVPRGTMQNQATFERTGFSDMNFLVWEHKNVSGQSASQMELSFTRPRRGIASWLSSPGPMGSLDFISPKAAIATSLRLKDPAQIFDDIADLATASNPNAMASVAQMETGLKISLRNDLFARLTGELAMELDPLPPQEPVWKVILQSKDPSGLLATLRTILTALRMSPAEFDEDGIAYHTITIPSSQKRLEITYAMVEGYLIVGSGRDAVSAAVRLHREGGSLAKSRKLAASLPPSPTGTDVSALLYEDPMAMASMSLRNISPDLANSFMKSAMVDSPAVVMAGYGEDSALREENRSGGVDVGAGLVVAAIAIPNLIRARIAANDSSAVATLRTANTAQITYQMTYPRRGYAHDFATLGPDPKGSSTPSAQHASIIDSALGSQDCTAGAWCVNAGYRFTITTSCKLQPCQEYLVLATPVGSGTGTRNFCTTSDAVIRSQVGPPLNAPISAAQCRGWPPLQ
jgi:hypothetical protein